MDLSGRKVNILGTEYQVLIQSEEENPKLKDCNGLCEQYSKKIILSDFKESENDPMLVENFQAFKNKILRHEIIHAFFGESGLRSQSNYAENEELIDWLAIQSPKIFEAFKELDVLE